MWRCKMKILSFESVIEAYMAAEGTTLIKEGDIRAKYTEVAEALGIDSKLLRKHTGVDINDDYENITDQTPLVVGEEDVPFVIEIVQNYSTPNFKNIRKRNFKEVPTDIVKSLIERFTKLLFDLGHKRETIGRQVNSMEMTTQYTLRLCKQRIFKDLSGFMEEIATEKKCYDYIEYLDEIEKAHYAGEQIFDAISNITGVLREYEFVRFDLENYEYEQLYERSESDELRWEQEERVEDILQKNEEYLSLWERERELNDKSSGFVKRKNSQLKKINRRKRELRTQVEKSLFGVKLEPLKDEPSRIGAAPEEVLEKAIAQNKFYEEKFQKEDEVWKKKFRKKYSQEEIDAMVKKWRKESKQLDVWDYLQ